MKRNITRITEADLHRMIRESVRKVLKEQNDNMLLQVIAQKIASGPTVTASVGENEEEVELGNGTYAVVVFELTSNAYIKQGMRSNSYDVPDDPDEIANEDDFDINVIEIALEDGSIEDNGIVRNALMSNVEIDFDWDELPSEDEFNYYED